MVRFKRGDLKFGREKNLSGRLDQMAENIKLNGIRLLVIWWLERFVSWFIAKIVVVLGNKVMWTQKEVLIFWKDSEGVLAFGQWDNLDFYGFYGFL